MEHQQWLIDVGIQPANHATIREKWIQFKPDLAMQALEKGGIDLNPAQMSMQVKKEGEDFKFNFNGTEIDAAQVTGATFTIRTMTPVTNLPLILGLNFEPADKLNPATGSFLYNTSPIFQTKKNLPLN